MKKGDLIVVAFSYGTQLAEVLDARRPDGRWPVRKWRAAGRRWTQRVLVTETQLRGKADAKRIAEAKRHGAFTPDDRNDATFALYGAE